MFIDDIEKMSDFLIETEDNFLQQYSYLTQKEYNETKKYFQDNKVDVLSDMYRQAENLYIEELNGRETNTTVQSENLKCRIIYYIEQYCTIKDREEFYELIDSMGC